MYQLRRERLLESLPNYSIALLYSGKAPYSVGDETYPFVVNRSFYYFTGLNNENEVLMFVKMPHLVTSILFIEHFDPTQAKWVGARILPKEASEISGINDVRYIDEVKETVSRYVCTFGKIAKFNLWADLSNQYLGQENYCTNIVNEVKEQQPDVQIHNLYEKICRMRMAKDETEITLMKHAIGVTNRGIMAMMQSSREYIYENELEAYFDFVLKSEQCGHAFETICAAGKNATVLHYRDNNAQSNHNDLVLCDLGAEYKLYKADITRTYPINGKFTPRQREIYEIVLNGNKLVQSLAKPGVTTVWLNQKLLEYYEVELKKVGLLEDGKTVRDYYWHSVSHHIGLETHDVSLPNEPLVAGCVISNEPGLYIESEGIGIRIEDDLLITEEGCENLSQNIMKEPDEIENFMAKRFQNN